MIRFRCDGGIVSIGDIVVDLLGKCGQPAMLDAWQVERGVLIVVQDAPALETASAVQVVEQWTYNLGPQRFIQIVSVERGRVTAVQREGYGYVSGRLAGGMRRHECAPPTHLGDTKLDVLAHCGEPVSREVRVEKRAGTAMNGQVLPVGFATVMVEVWTFDFGPQRFIQILTLEDGRVVSVESGGYGYAR